MLSELKVKKCVKKAVLMNFVMILYKMHFVMISI